MKEVVDRLKTIEVLAEGNLTASITAQRFNMSAIRTCNLLASEPTKPDVSGLVGLSELGPDPEGLLLNLHHYDRHWRN